MSFETNLEDLVTRISTQCKTLLTLINNNAADLSALDTTAKHDLVAAINEVAALATGAPDDASESTAGIAKIATQTQTNTGTDDATIVTPLKFQTRLAAYAVPLSDLDTDTSLAANSDSRVATQKAIKAYVDALLAANDAMIFKGVIDASTNPNYPAGNAGDTWRISVAGKIGGASGVSVEAGDLAICITDGTSTGSQASVGTHWTIAQTNSDGAVTGPASATDSHLATFNGTSGKVIEDSGLMVTTDASTNSDGLVPTNKAVQTYLEDNYYDQDDIGDITTNFVDVFEAGLS